MLAVDPSALVHRYVVGPHRALVNEAMNNDSQWGASALARTEILVALHRLATDPYTADELWRAARHDWDAMHVVPVDERCLAHAAELGSTYGLRTVDAIHLAAADRLPRPVRYLTLERRQIPAATAIGLEVVAPVA